MIKDIEGLHHVTSLASDARENNRFFTDVLGLRRVKKTVNFDAPEVYHLYYGDAVGTPGTVMTYFPFQGMRRHRAGVGETGATAFSVPRGAVPYWSDRLATSGVELHGDPGAFGDIRLNFKGPDGDGFVLIETDDDPRPGCTGSGVPDDVAIRGFHSVRFRVSDGAPLRELLAFMGYAPVARDGNVERMVSRSAEGGTSRAVFVDIETAGGSATQPRQGAGSVHHVAFAVPDLAAEERVRAALVDTGYQVTPVIDRDYFKSIYFRVPGGILFEIATNEPGFARDEPVDALGSDLKLPSQHAHLRAALEQTLPAI